MGRPDEKCLPGLGGRCLPHWTPASPGWMILFAIGTSGRLLLNSPGAFLIIDVLLTSAPTTAGLMAANPGHMAQALALIAAGNPAVPVEEFNCMMYIA